MKNPQHASSRAHLDMVFTRYLTRFVASTAMTELNPPGDPTPQQVWDDRLPSAPLGVGSMEPSDIGPAAVLLASEGAAMVTGAAIEIDAGESAYAICARRPQCFE